MLPKLKTREEMLEILQREEYGYLPPLPQEMHFAVEENFLKKNYCAGKAEIHKVTAEGKVNGRSFSFPFFAILPTDGKKHPFFVHVSFLNTPRDLYQPTEELIDNGFAVLSVCYKDVTSDDGDFENGVAGALYDKGARADTDAGKIAIWAWAAMRVMDYAETRGDVLDLSCGIVCGHSRLGKTALLAGAMDTRFAFAYSNDSGCSGAAISRGKQGETVEKIYNRFPYWFCENYKKYMNREDEMPFDQHYLVASIAPRYVLIGSAREDLWADPAAEKRCCIAASPAFTKGFADEGEVSLAGDLGYHIRPGTHYFSRQDWNRLMDFVRLHKGEE